MTTFTTDNRWSPGASGATVPDNAAAAYAARWIDQGDGVPADVDVDRQGFAYNAATARDVLIERLVAEGSGLRIPQPARDVTITVVSTPTFTCVQRRAGGYVYAEAWVTP